MKNKKGFTLVELLAVIAILAILVIIALPNVINMYNKAQKETFLTEARKVYTEAEKKYISSSITGNTVKVINSKDSSKLDMTGEKLQYCIILNNSGKVNSMKVSNGKWIASLNDKNIEDLTIDDLEDGNLDGYECGPKKPKSFKDDSWDTIAEAVRSGNDGAYNVGDTKEVDLGELGKHNVRIANKSTPSECSTEGFSQSACGFVLEFEDIITKHSMNPSGDYKGTTYNYGHNIGGWPASTMYNYVNIDIYNMLPADLKSVIINTMVVSSHGSGDSANFTSTDKLYLLSPKEIYGGSTSAWDSSVDLTRKLDYYNSINQNPNNSLGASKRSGSTSYWWLRSATSIENYYFFSVDSKGYINGRSSAQTAFGVSPAFRIG